MKKKIIILIIIILAVYCNRMYAKIYNHMEESNLVNTYEKTSANMIINPNNFEEEIHYTALGDSLTAGVGTDNIKESYPYLLAEKFAENKKVILNNFGVPGATAEGVINSELDDAIVINSDIITLLIGTNDVHNHVSRDLFKTNVENILSTLKNKTGAHIILINIPYLEQSELFTFVYKKYFDSKIQKYNEILESVAKQNNLEIIDLYSYTKQNKPDYSLDLFHPSSEGYKKWADFFYDDIR